MYRLRCLRMDAGLTMKELGTIIGVAESTVSQWETGKRNPNYDTLIRLANFFEVTADYLIRGEAELRDSRGIAYPRGSQMEYDYSKLKGRIVEMYGNQGNFAGLFPISERSLSRKLNNLVSFKQPEIQRLCALLEIPLEEIPEYFFTEMIPTEANEATQTDEVELMIKKLLELPPKMRHVVVKAAESFMVGLGFIGDASENKTKT